MENFYRHVHPEIKEGMNSKRKKSLRSVTVTGVYNPEDNSLRFGEAVCCTKDQYVKKIGRKISTGRALSDKATVVLQARDRDEALELFHTYCNDIGGKQVKLKKQR